MKSADRKELVATIALGILMLTLAATSLPGLIVATVWACVGIWMVSRSRSRGLLADASFVITWPVYVALRR